MTDSPPIPQRSEDKPLKSNPPFYALIATGILIVAAVVLVIFTPPEREGVTMILGFIVSTLPSLVAAVYSERAARDIRNGVMEQKAKDGAVRAIEETQVLTRTGPVVAAELAALSTLLRQNTSATRENTNVLTSNDEGRENDG